MTYKAIGWVRDCKGFVIRYCLKDISNAITTFCGGGIGKDSATGMYNTTPYILVEYDV